MTVTSQDFTDFSFDADDNFIWPDRIIADPWIVEVDAGTSLILEYGTAGSAARKFTAVSSTAGGDQQYDEFWLMLDPRSQTALVRYLHTVNNTEPDYVASFGANYVSISDRMQLTVTAAKATRIRLTTLSIELN